MRAGAHDVVLQIVRIVVTPHAVSPRYINIIHLLSGFVHRFAGASSVFPEQWKIQMKALWKLLPFLFIMERKGASYCRWVNCTKQMLKRMPTRDDLENIHYHLQFIYGDDPLFLLSSN
jgi:hypothetical protein